MRLQFPVSLLFAISALHGTSSALPFLQLRGSPTEPIVARATYSIVPIDGSGGEGGDSSTDEPPATVIQTRTIVSTQTPTTKTVIESSPPVTSIYTVTANPTTYTQTVPTTISIIDIKSTTAVTTTTVTEDDEPTFVVTPSSSVPAPTSTSQTTPTSLASPTFPASYSVNLTSISVESTIPTLAPTSTSLASNSYDDGLWHTKYSSWNGTVVRRSLNPSQISVTSGKL